MKTYLFITTSILTVGGMQMYISGKAEYLEQHGWNVKVAFSDFHDEPCQIPSLEPYRDGCIYGVNMPPFRFPSVTRRKILNRLISLVGRDNEELIIETHDDRSAPWGELLAGKLGGKHIVVLLNETYRGPDKYYEDQIDFYSFKHQRREISGVATLRALFAGYREIPDEETRRFRIDEDPVRDVPSEKVENLARMDWNICYLGRTEKTYVPSVIEGVAEFARNHPDKTVQFAIVGDDSILTDVLEKHCAGVSNLTVTKLGVMIPLPKSLFPKMDVFIASGGSGRCVAYEGALDIVPDPIGFVSNGLLGYDTESSSRHAPGTAQRPFAEELERALVRREQDGMNYHFERLGIETCVKQNFEFIQNSCQTKEYYDPKRLISGKRDPSLRFQLKHFLALFCPGLFHSIMRRRSL